MCRKQQLPKEIIGRVHNECQEALESGRACSLSFWHPAFTHIMNESTEEQNRERSTYSGLESREYGRRDPSRWPRGTLYPQKLALTSLPSGCRSVGVVRSRTKAT
jgi:hypothetical protein